MIDLQRAARDPSTSLVATVPAPCAPVRVAVSPDGTIVWVTAKDANALLGFSATHLRTDPARALVSVTHVGSQPLGLAVADRGAIVLVADADLSHAQGAHSAISVVDARSSGRPALLGALPAGRLADAISVLPAGNRALVTNSDSRQLEALMLGRP